MIAHKTLLCLCPLLDRIGSMQRKTCYFDNAATTLISPQALRTYEETALMHMANPSASYAAGRESHRLLESARASVAEVLGVKSSNIFFTSGATESIGIVMSSLLWAKTPGEVLISAIEHEAVGAWAAILKEKGWTVRTIPARGGFIRPETLEGMLTKSTRLVAVMAVNNVLGTIQDMKGLSEVIRRKESEFGRRIFLFSDSVQALGKTDFTPGRLDIDGASFSGHKIHGPRGVGILYLSNPRIQVLSHGGGQEGGVRGGTENLPAIAALAVACRQLAERDISHIVQMNRLIRDGLSGTDKTVLSPEHDTTPYILSIATHLPSEVALRMLQDKGYLVSSGSACSNNARGKAESVYRACGFDRYASGALRISFSHDNTLEEAQGLLEALREL